MDELRRIVLDSFWHCIATRTISRIRCSVPRPQHAIAFVRQCLVCLLQIPCLSAIPLFSLSLFIIRRRSDFVVRVVSLVYVSILSLSKISLILVVPLQFNSFFSIYYCYRAFQHLLSLLISWVAFPFHPIRVPVEKPAPDVFWLRNLLSRDLHASK